MRAAVLAGGLGTRLRPYTTVLPKPLVPLGDRPILELILAWLARGGVDEVDVCVGHLGHLIQTYFSQAQTLPAGMTVRWQREHEPLGTAGALRSLRDVGESLLVVNGDILTDVDPRAVVAYHRAQGAALTICTHRARVPTELGVIIHEDGVVSGYREKPVLEYTASMGVYVYEPFVLRNLPDGPLQFPDLVLRLLAQGHRVAALETDATWTHINTIEQHEEAARRLEGSTSPAVDSDRGAD